ncbi:MAG: S9 family peptidase [Candidatus Aminicenantes bacterium]|nr:S9 family peptidase [Candidatus Aminicenantes bacterium]
MKRKAFLVLCLFFLVLVVFSSWVPGQEGEKKEVEKPRVISFDDIQSFKGVSGIISPDGETILYIVQEIDREKNETHSFAWKIPFQGGEAIKMTTEPLKDRAFQWKPDSKRFSFLGERGKDKGLFIMNPNGGEPEKLFDHEEGINEYKWSPDGKKIAFIARDKLSKHKEKLKKEKKDAVVEDQDFVMSHLWIYDTETKKAERLTEGSDFTVNSFNWSPDSKAITFSATPTPRPIDSPKSDVYIISAEIPKSSLEEKEEKAEKEEEKEEEKPKVKLPAPKKLTVNPGADANPQFTPDGKYIVYRIQEPGELIGYSRAARLSIEGETPEDISPKMDVQPSSYQFTPDGETVYFSATTGTESHIYRMSLKDRIPQAITVGSGVWSGVNFCKGRKRMAFSYTDTSQPAELHSSLTSEYKPKKLTNLNQNIENFKLGKTEVIRWKSFDNLEIEGLLVYPVDFEEGEKYPLIVQIHGGPSGVYTKSFDVTGQYFAGQGYFYFKPNFRGSSGYGDEFQRADIGDWGGGDYQDIITGVRHLIKKGFIDEERMGVMGWSYGGYMTAWVVTQTDIFKAAVVGAGITENISMWGTQDIPHVFEAYFGGGPYEKGLMELYLKLSPLSHVRKAKTPTLILHGENDQRVPTGQASLFYRALKAVKIPTQLVWYPRSGHGPREPNLRLDVVKRQAAWFSKYLLGKEMEIWPEEKEEKK